MVERVRTLIVADEGLLRDGLSAVLRSEQYLDIVDVVTGSSLAAPVPLPEVDVVVIGQAVADRDTTEICARIKQRWRDARIVLLTFTSGTKAVSNALHAGVDAFVLLTDRRQDMATAISAVMAGKTYISPAAGTKMPLAALAGVKTSRPAMLESGASLHTEDDGLSDREREVMKQIARGLRTREIAFQLSLSQKTIEKHRSNLMRKLGLRSATAVAAYAIANGYLRR